MLALILMTLNDLEQTFPEHVIGCMVSLLVELER